MARLYLSSTYVDLKNFRTAAANAIRRLGHVDIAMEHYVAESRRPLSRCLKDIRIADAYIGLFGYRYGYIPEGRDCSITELEFRQAVDCGKTHLSSCCRKTPLGALRRKLVPANEGSRACELN
jgi:hypothetical protein